MNHQITISKRTALSAALCMALGTGVAEAAPWSGTFTMFSGGGGVVGVDQTVTGTEKSTLESTTPFFGLVWTAHDLTTYGPGTYTIDTGNGNYTFTVNAGYLAGHMLFDWGASTNIDVVNMWKVTTQSDGSTTYESIDFDCGAGTDNIRGCAMIDGPFQGFNANFDMTAFTAFAVNISATQGSVPMVIATKSGGNVTLRTNRTAAGGYTFSWAGSDANLTGAAVGGTASETFVFDPSGLTNGTTYSVQVAVTNSSSQTVTATSSVTIEPSTALSGSTDTDGDGLVDNDNSEGYPDNDGDGIPNYLDPTNDDASLVAVNTTDTSLGSMSTSAGTVSLGATALSNSITNMVNGTAASGLAVTIDDIGTTDDAVKSSCVGGCFDFKVKGVTEGSSPKVVIPLSTALGSYPAYRKFNNSKWNGFVIDDNNSISSAPATSTDPVTCPAAGSSSYSNVGLTPGDQCIQLTIEDGGPNDADGVADGIVTDPGGIGTTGEEIMMADVPNGCSMSTTPVNPTERADWWLVAGFLGALAWLRGMRQKARA